VSAPLPVTDRRRLNTQADPAERAVETWPSADWKVITSSVKRCRTRNVGTAHICGACQGLIQFGPDDADGARTWACECTVRRWVR
jgi:hypothetical protein